MSLTQEQLALRRSGITGTDMPALLGLSAYRTPLDVWLDKRGVAPAVEVTEDMERGIFLEEGARRWYAHRTGAKWVTEVGTVVSSRYPVCIATPDGVAYFDDGTAKVLEIKMPSSAAGWGEQGTDAVPEWYLPQVLWELAACNLEHADVFAVLDGRPRIYHVTRDAEAEGLLVEAAERFWKDHVVSGTPPPVEARDNATVTRWLRKHDGEYMEFSGLPPEAQVVLEEYLRAHSEQAAASERLATWETRAKLMLGAAPGVRGLPEALGYHRLDWKAQAGKTAWKRVAEALAKQHGVSEAQLSALASENVGEAFRPFRPVKTKERK